MRYTDDQSTQSTESVFMDPLQHCGEQLQRWGMGLQRYTGSYKITKRQHTVEACLLSAASPLFTSTRCGRRGSNQQGILHDHVIWALCFDTAHEGHTYLWRVQCEAATGKKRGGGGDATSQQICLWTVHMFLGAFTPQFCKAIKSYIVTMQAALASSMQPYVFCQSAIMSVGVRALEEFK